MSSGSVPAGFVDARGLADGDRVVADVCVVGSGAAGTSLALRLRERGRSVTLLEAGGGESDAESEAFLQLETTGLSVGPESRQRFLGGTTNSWWGVAAVLDDLEFAPRPWLGVPAWPIKREVVLPYYRQASRLLGVPDLTGVEASRPPGRRGFLFQTSELDTVTLYWPRRPRRFAPLLSEAVRTDHDLRAYLHANVTRIVPGPGGTTVDQLEVRTLTGRSFAVHANEVVLACGGIENARLLLASGGRNGLGDGAAAVGRYFMDHPKGVAGRIAVRGAPTLPHPGYWESRPGTFRLGVRLSPERQRRDGLLDGYVRFHPVLAAEGRATSAIREVYRRRAAALRDAHVLKDLARGVPELLAKGWFRASGRGTVRTIELHNFLEQAPRPENRVTLSDRVDPLGNRLAKLEWSIGETDRRTMRTLHSALDEELRRRGVGTLESPILAAEADGWPISRDASHHMGTTRMGDDPSTSVVDGDCRVHGVHNLSIAGSSVFPTSGFANPTLTIVALALRLADRMAVA